MGSREAVFSQKGHVRALVALGSLAVVALCVGILASGHQVEGGVEEATARAQEMALINACIMEFTDATQVTLDGPLAELTDSVKASVRERFAAGLARTATEEFAARFRMLHDPVAFLEEDMGDRELGTPLVYERQLVKTELRKALPDGDVVVWATWWTGSVRSRDRDVATGTAGGTVSIDNLPVIEYVMTKADGTWRVADLVYVDFGPDDDPHQYGPDTPHGHEFNPDVESIRGLE
jgi:hypothetical protein